MAFMFQAALWCDSCAAEIKRELDAKGVQSDDSDTYPQDVGDPGESDSPDHCDAGAECLEAEELFGGRKIGAHLGGELTEEGRRWVLETVRESYTGKAPHARDYAEWLRGTFEHEIDFGSLNAEEEA